MNSKSYGFIHEDLIRFSPTGPASDDGPCVPSLPTAGRNELLSGGERPLFALVPAGAPI